MKKQRCFHWTVLLIAALFVACGPMAAQPQAPTATPPPSAPPTPTPLPSPTPTPVPSATVPPSPTPAWPPLLTLPYTPGDDPANGSIRGRLFFPSEHVPPLTVYAVATDGSRTYEVSTQAVPPGEPSYEIAQVEPGIYYVYGYPAIEQTPFGGAYSYLAACEAGHLPPPPDGCWEDPQQDLAPVEVRAGFAVEEINIFDWYGPTIPPPPGDTNS